MNNQGNLVERLLNQWQPLNKVAYQTPSQSVSYTGLSEQVAIAAQSLRDLGVKAGDRVIIALNDSPRYASLLLACFWVGAIAIPINPRLKTDAAAHIINDSGAALAFVEAAVIHLWHAAAVNTQCQQTLVVNGDVEDAQLVYIKLEEFLMNTPCEGRFFCGVLAADYLQYTSGTTGSPKGVMHQLSGMLASNQHYAKEILGINEHSRLYATAKMFFGYGLGASFFFTLLNNATALLDHRWPDKATVLDNWKNFNPTHLFSVPTLFASMADDVELPLIAKNSPVLVSAGATLPEHLFSVWRNRFGLTLLDSVGATEMGHVYLSPSIQTASGGSVGEPVPGYQVRLQPLADDQRADSSRGELWVKGPSMALGYYNKPEKTAEKFVDGWYRTGDYFCAEAGNYRFLGRTDECFKVKGRWVEPLSVEVFLAGLMPYAEGFLLLPQQTSQGLTQVCLVVAGSTAKQKASEVVAMVDASLPDYFPGYYQPANLYFIDHLPRNDNGKVVRFGLAERLSKADLYVRNPAKKTLLREA